MSKQKQGRWRQPGVLCGRLMWPWGPPSKSQIGRAGSGKGRLELPGRLHFFFSFTESSAVLSKPFN